MRTGDIWLVSRGGGAPGGSDNEIKVKVVSIESMVTVSVYVPGVAVPWVLFQVAKIAGLDTR